MEKYKTMSSNILSIRLFTVLIFFLYSCDHYSKNLTGTNFSVQWVNLPELTNIYYNYPNKDISVGILEHRITDVYWDNQYILAKRCKSSNDSLIGYYIIKITPSVMDVPESWEISDLLSEIEYVQAKLEYNLNEQTMMHTNIFKENISIFDWIFQ